MYSNILGLPFYRLGKGYSFKMPINNKGQDSLLKGKP